MPKTIFIVILLIFVASCSSAPPLRELTSEEEIRLAGDIGNCNARADDSARGFGVGGITWTRKWKEVFNYCIKTKGWMVLEDGGFFPRESNNSP